MTYANDCLLTCIEQILACNFDVTWAWHGVGASFGNLLINI